LILQALERSGGVKTKACGLLGVTFRSMRYRMSKLNMVTDGVDKEEDGDTQDELEDGRVSSPDV